MAREKYKTLTEQMFYVLLCLQKECCGVDVMKIVSEVTNGRVKIGAGTLYALLDSFLKEKIIIETRVENRKKSYIITSVGKSMLENEYQRLLILKNDYESFYTGSDNNER